MPSVIPYELRYDRGLPRITVGQAGFPDAVGALVAIRFEEISSEVGQRKRAVI